MDARRGAKHVVERLALDLDLPGACVLGGCFGACAVGCAARGWQRCVQQHNTPQRAHTHNTTRNGAHTFSSSPSLSMLLSMLAPPMPAVPQMPRCGTTTVYFLPPPPPASTTTRGRTLTRSCTRLRATLYSKNARKCGTGSHETVLLVVVVFVAGGGCNWVVRARAPQQQHAPRR